MDVEVVGPSLLVRGENHDLRTGGKSKAVGNTSARLILV